MAAYSRIAIFFFFFSLFLIVFSSQDEYCTATRCRNHGPLIQFPFRLKDNQTERCGYPGFELFCNEWKQTVLELPLTVKVLVKKIDYKSQEILVYDPDGCLPRQLPTLNLSSSPFQFNFIYYLNFSLYNCSKPNRNLGYSVPCFDVDGYRVYAIFSGGDIASQQLTSCTKIYNIGSVDQYVFDQSYIRLSWLKPNCSRCEAAGKICGRKNYSTTEPYEIDCFNKPKKDVSKEWEIAGSVVGSFLIVLAIIALYYFYSSSKMEKENQVKVEIFLEHYIALRPARYSYSDIKRITNNFRDKLGEGSYGVVYKGLLSHEIFVAVKLLKNSKENGEEFINEVGTIGKIHHVNVVRLVGFCADGFIRALVYEFLPNDSLEKYIFSENPNNHSLGWKRLQDIALGIAKGIEYLHQGCDQRILHFDIKPHNILLDQNFSPKISDFGLAKLCSKEQSAVSMTAARGTMGYIAPEVLSRNFGKVSYKSDVYSYGMLLLEMVGGRKNVDVTVENTSQMYFPEWVYKSLERGEELWIRIEEDGDAKIVKKLSIVGLWCIQWNPVDRPSMKVVIQMLEEETDNLIVPPNPFATTNATRPGGRLQQELAVISELE